MLLFFDFERLLWNQTTGSTGPAARLAQVLDCFATVELVMIRWSVGPFRTVDDLRKEVPELGNHFRHLAHRPVRSDLFPEREITGSLRKLRQLYWAAVVHERLAGGYISTAQSSGAPLVLCSNGFNDSDAERLSLALCRIVHDEHLASADHVFYPQKELSCDS